MKNTGDTILYRVRRGDYRIVYCVDEDAKTVTVARIGHRKDIYKNRY